MEIFEKSWNFIDNFTRIIFIMNLIKNSVENTLEND